MVTDSSISSKKTLEALKSPSLGDPKELIVKVNVEKLKNLTLALEQMLILVFNPQYNKIKVAGGTVAGITRKPESMLPAAKKKQ